MSIPLAEHACPPNAWSSKNILVAANLAVANPAWFRGVSFCTIDFPMFHSVFVPPPQKKHVGFPPVRLQEGPVENVAICWVYRWGWPGILTCGVGWGGVGWGAKVLRLGWGGVGWGVLTFVFICKHGTLLVCHVITQSQCHVWLTIVSSSWLGSMYFFLPCVSKTPLSFSVTLGACASTRTYRDMRPWEQGVLCTTQNFHSSLFNLRSFFFKGIPP